MTGWTSPVHIVVLLLLALLLFGAKRLPEIGRSLGHGMREFKDSVSGTSPEEGRGMPQRTQPREEAAPAASMREHEAA